MIFRLAYAFRLRTGLIRLQFPQYKWEDRPLKTWLRAERSANKDEAPSQENLAGRVARVFFAGVSRPNEDEAPWDQQKAVEEANRILSGELKYFSHQFIKTDFPPNWHTDYVTDTSIDSYKHWSQISDDANVDIKFIWEPNRFTFVYTLVRAYVASHNEEYPEAFWTLIEDWAQHNPPNTGPNWMDGQEIALRLMAWTFGYFAFLDSPSSTPERKENFVLYVAAQAERIYKNRSFAIFTHGNHSITEAFGLWMTGLLFPELKNAEKYLSFGRKSLEHEAREQIFPDGTYSMYSLNYHRFILHIYLYAIQLGEINHFPLSTQLKDSVAKSITYLSQLIDPQTGRMPVYGSNDGALVLPLNNCDFTDYRPLLQLGWYITKGEKLFESGDWDEDLFWICGESALIPSPSPRGRRESSAESPSPSGRGVRDEGEVSFAYGGTYLLRSPNSHVLIRCMDFTSRPSHADQLHVDLWIHGHNIAIDAGTYLYSGEGHWRNGLAHTPVHNTVTVDNKDQMTMLSRFTWTNWSKGKVLKHEKDIWQGEHDGYKPVSHKRTVMALEGDRWLVIDDLASNELHNYKLHWLLADFGIQKLASGYRLLLPPTKTDSKLSVSKFLIQMGLLGGNGKFSVVREDPASTRGWRSRYYGHKEPAISVMLEADQPQVTFWSFFGFENDIVEIEGNTLKINSQNISLVE